MEYDLDRILAGMTAADDAVRLSATAALEEALKAELDAGRSDWEPLVDRLLEPLIRAIGDRHKGVQVHSGDCLEFLCYQSGRVIPALRATMAGGDQWRAWGAAILAARMGLWFPEMAPALSAALGSQDRDVRWAAAGYSLQLGRSHEEAVAMVKGSLRSPNPVARKMAAYCLGAAGQFAAVEDALVPHLTDPEREVRRAVVLALDKLPAVSEAVKQQVAAMRTGDPDEFVRRTAEAVAGKWGV